MATRVRVIPNRHGSAQAACDKWLAGSLRGMALSFGRGNIHVYGTWRKRQPVQVQFTDDKIVVMRGRIVVRPKQ